MPAEAAGLLGGAQLGATTRRAPESSQAGSGECTASAGDRSNAHAPLLHRNTLARSQSRRLSLAHFDASSGLACLHRELRRRASRGSLTPRRTCGTTPHSRHRRCGDNSSARRWSGRSAGSSWRRRRRRSARPPRGQRCSLRAHSPRTSHPLPEGGNRGGTMGLTTILLKRGQCLFF